MTIRSNHRAQLSPGLGRQLPQKDGADLVTSISDYTQACFYYLSPWMFVYCLNKEDSYKVAVFKLSSLLTFSPFLYLHRLLNTSSTKLYYLLCSTKHFIKYLGM